MEILEKSREAFAPALALAKQVFLAYEAPEYPPEGVENFCKTLCDEAYLSQLRVYTAEENGEVRGMLATRSGGSHIALFFVDGAFHRRGIGRALFLRAASHHAAGRMTVNASHYACGVYHALGFADTDTEQTVDGMRFTPMACNLTPNNILALRKQSFAIPCDNGMVWCEHLDGIGSFSALVREKFLQDWPLMRRPSESGTAAINLDDTGVTPEIVRDICTALLSGEKRFVRIAFVGLAVRDRAAFQKNLAGAPFGLWFTPDFQAAKEWLVHGRH